MDANILSIKQNINCAQEADVAQSPNESSVTKDLLSAGGSLDHIVDPSLNDPKYGNLNILVESNFQEAPLLYPYLVQMNIVAAFKFHSIEMRGPLSLPLACVLLLALPGLCFIYEDTISSFQQSQLEIEFQALNDNFMLLGTDYLMTLSYRYPNDKGPWLPFMVPDNFNETLKKVMRCVTCISLTDQTIPPKGQWRLINVGNQDVSYRFEITTLTWYSLLDQNTINSMYLRRSYLNQKTRNDKFIVSLLNQDLTSGIILPFNMITNKQGPVLSTQLQSTKPLAYPFAIPRFESSYWIQNSATAVAMPWVPYLSRCQKFDRYMFIHELLDDPTCISESLQNNFKIQNGIPYLSNYQNKGRCQMKIQCVLQEWNVTSNDKPWWRSSNKILFYLFPTPIDKEEMRELQMDGSRKTELMKNFHRDLIPVYFSQGKCPTNYLPSNLELSLEYYTRDSQIAIGTAILSTLCSNVSNSTVNLTVVIAPITFAKGVTNYYLPAFMYFIVFSIFSFSFQVIVMSILMVSIPNFKKTLIKLVSLTLLPLIKGLGLATITSFLFVASFFVLGKLTRFSLLNASYDGNLNSQILMTGIYNGRVGLCLVFSGTLSLYGCISQLYKIPNENEAKILTSEKKKMATRRSLQTSKSLRVKEEKELEDTVTHIVKMLSSKKFYTFVCVYIVNVVTLYEMQLLITINETMYLQMVLPLLCSLYQLIYKYLLVKDSLITYIVGGSQHLLLGLLLIKSSNIQTLLTNYVVFEIYEFIITHLMESLEVKVRHFVLMTSSEPLVERLKMCLQYRLGAFRKEGQNYNDKLVPLLVKMTVGFIRPVFVVMIYFTQVESMINSQALIQNKMVIIQILFMVCIILIEIGARWILLLLSNSVDYLKMLEYGLYRFKTRPTKWAHERLGSTSDNTYFRAVHDMGYSSQMYFFVSSMIYSLMSISWGGSIVLRNRYKIFGDPAFFIILILAFLSYKVGFLVFAFIGNKIKAYEVETEKAISDLKVISVYLRRQDLLEYSDLRIVKEYFVNKNKSWIVENLFKIFNKADLLRHNGFLLNKYRHYLNLQKAEMMNSKNKGIRDKTGKTERLNIIDIDKHTLDSAVVPLITRWLGLAKEHLFLKNLVSESQLRENKLVGFCQKCNSSQYVELVEKYPMYSIANKFRKFNLGRPFNPNIFVEFYDNSQGFREMCYECIEREKSQKGSLTSGMAKKLLKKLTLKWIILARGRLLHLRAPKQKTELQFQRSKASLPLPPRSQSVIDQVLCQSMSLILEENR